MCSTRWTRHSEGPQGGTCPQNFRDGTLLTDMIFWARWGEIAQVVVTKTALGQKWEASNGSDDSIALFIPESLYSEVPLSGYPEHSRSSASDQQKESDAHSYESYLAHISNPRWRREWTGTGHDVDQRIAVEYLQSDDETGGQGMLTISAAFMAMLWNGRRRLCT